MEELSILVSGENAGVIGAIIAMISTAKASVPKLFTKPRFKRWVPVLPIVLGLLAVFLGFGTAGDSVTDWQDRVVLGSIIGFTAGQLYKAGKTSIFGWGIPNKEEIAAGEKE